MHAAARDDYRPELDGLRALAVLMVVGFHAGVAGFSGGFLGVDVFFVLSGYLITADSLRRRRAGTFSPLHFWERRVRRIIPALYTMLALCIPFAAFTMLPDALDVFGQGLLASTLSMNNVLQYLTSGYWQVANEFKPLMHTWSLGIEEQVYLLFPVFLLASARWPRAVSLAVLAAAVASLAWAEVTVRTDPLAAFLLPQARLSEFAAGALLAAWEARRPRATPPRFGGPLVLAGLVLLFACFARFEPSTPHPGVSTLLPVAATLLVVASSTAREGPGRWLAWPPLVTVGLMSYSLYLWHQPALAFTRLRSELPPPPLAIAVALAASLCLAYASWRTVEAFGRYRASSRTVWSVAAVGGVALVMAGWWLHTNPGMGRSGEAAVAGVTSPIRHEAARLNEEARRLGASGEGRILVVGNSFARDFINAALSQGSLRASQLSYAERFPECITALDEGLREKLSRAQVLVFGSPPGDPSCWPATLERLQAAGIRRIVVIGPKNFGWNFNYLAALAPADRFAYRAPVLPGVLQENAAWKAAVGPQHYVDLMDLLGESQGRVALFTPGRELVSQDLAHFTAAGARHAGKLLFEHPLLADLK